MFLLMLVGWLFFNGSWFGSNRENAEAVNLFQLVKRGSLFFKAYLQWCSKLFEQNSIFYSQNCIRAIKCVRLVSVSLEKC